MTTYASWLRDLGETRLAEVLRLRPDAALPPQPKDVGELAGRLSSPTSTVRALGQLDVRCLEVAEVLQALGDGAPRAALDELTDALPRQEVEGALGRLERLGLAWTEPDGRIRLPGAMRQLVPTPLNLGAPASRMLGAMTSSSLDGVLRAVGEKPGGRKDDKVALLVRRLSDPGWVRRLVSGAPPQARKLLEHLALEGPLLEQPDYYGYGGYGRSGDPAVRWAEERALLLRRDWSCLELPREVGLALRPEGWRPHFAAAPPPVDRVDVASELVRGQAAAALSAGVESVTALLDEIAGAPLSALKSGGVGARELRRVAKAVRCEEDEAALWLELAYAAGLLAPSDGEVLVSEGFDDWRAGDPAARAVPLLLAWHESNRAATVRSDPVDGGGGSKALPVLAGFRLPYGDAPRVVRESVLSLLVTSDGRAAADVEALLARALWQRPLTHPVGEEDQRLGAALARAAWREAELLGVVAADALTPLGAVLAGDPDPEQVERVVDELLPAAQETATFQADLTAVVAGAPSAALAALLDGAGELEQRGGASVWRFSPASVRRAFDSGATAQSLLDELAAVAARGLPQPLSYLVTDTARRHGQVRVRPVACCVHAEDEALLAEIAATRALAPLALRRLAPTVLTSAKSVPDTLDALRAAGYAPVGETADGTAKVERAPRRRAPTPGRRPGADQVRAALGLAAPRSRGTLPEQLGAEELARKLVTAPPPAPPPGADVLPFPVQPPEPQDDELARAEHLEPHELALLRHARDTGGPVLITYESSSGQTTDRVIDNLVVDGPVLLAWCHLRQDARTFSLSGVLAVAPVEAQLP